MFIVNNNCPFFKNQFLFCNDLTIEIRLWTMLIFIRNVALIENNRYFRLKKIKLFEVKLEVLY